MRHLETQGLLPPFFDAARCEAQDQQDAEDAGEQAVDFFFEVPLQVAQRIAGFKHNEPAAGIDLGAFETLGSPGGAPATILARRASARPRAASPSLMSPNLHSNIARVVSS